LKGTPLYNKRVPQKKERSKMGKTLGRPKSDNPKNKQLKIKMTEQDFNNLEELAKKKNMTKTDIVMRGIELVKSEP
ncbi:hypothetical protein, partial [Streptococcus pneumoniae]